MHWGSGVALRTLKSQNGLTFYSDEGPSLDTSVVGLSQVSGVPSPFWFFKHVVRQYRHSTFSSLLGSEEAPPAKKLPYKSLYLFVV